MATVTEFTIIQGKQLEFTIIVKENGTTMPLVLDPADTFTFSLVNKKTNEKYVDSKAMTITSALNGEVTGIISATESATLPLKRASAEDNFIPRPNIRMVVHGNTLTQGEMTAYIEDIYVLIG